MSMSAVQSSLQPEERRALRHVAERLVEEFTPDVEPQTVEEYVRSSYLHLIEHARIQRFVPLLAERFARQRLAAFAKLEGRFENGTPTAVFLDEHNAGRSQMARKILNHLADGRAQAWSGGRTPTAEVDENVAVAMREMDLDLRDEFPKPWTPEVLAAADQIVLMGTGLDESVDAEVIRWDVPDPLGLGLDEVRAIRDDLHRRVAELLPSL